ncbi:MAG TPA: UDP-glucose 4-epimerase GalE [Clostridiales bacterium]|nr:UDP-glucose 4-epimerase GalE [Clostridiales bacterium]
MKILLTGGAGYIGSHTAVELLEAGYDVVIADNFVNSSEKVIDRIQVITGKKPMLYPIDVADKDVLMKIFTENEIAAVIHFAGFKAVGESVKLPLKYYRNNLDTTLSLLETMALAKVRTFVFSSSATVYGDAVAPYTEEMKTGPCANPYGWTKLMNEEFLLDYAAADPTFSAVLLRYFNPVGAHQSGLIGEAPNGIPNNLMPYITQVAVGKLKQLNIFGNDYDTKDGTCIRDYIHVVDLAKGHVAAVQYGMEHQGAEPFNIGTGVGYSVKELVDTFASVNEVEIPYVFASRREGDLPVFYADPQKAAKILGWQAQLSLSDMCRTAWNWQKNNPNGYNQ